MPQNEALQLCIKISSAIDRVEYMFTTEFEAEVEESESTTLHQYYREAMIQGYNFAFEVRTSWFNRSTSFTCALSGSKLQCTSHTSTELSTNGNFSVGAVTACVTL